ncbi:MAG: hypothetical protein JXP48_06850 [Acidobacteria bacterium]|nr:hypothetical protein [Acidobacteriota bacterium]
MGRICGWVLVALAVLAAARVSPGAEEQKFFVEIEAGPAWQTKNDVRVPNSDAGTKFSLRDLEGSGPFAAPRVTLFVKLAPKHEIGFLAAPLNIKATGSLDHPVEFAGASFPGGPGVEAVYRFNSYRATYRYRVYQGESWTWKLGVTGKIRDAKIELRSGDTVAVDDNLGFVPLVHLDGECRLGERWRLDVNADGLGAPQGRAIDLALRARYALSPNWSVSAGYRMLEGGADVDKVYTFAWVHYAVAGVRFGF